MTSIEDSDGVALAVMLPLSLFSALDIPFFLCLSLCNYDSFFFYFGLSAHC